jgi:hypothetical protein
MDSKAKLLISALTLASAIGSTAANANQLALYGQSIDFDYWNGSACLTIGDAISCSAPLLNVLSGLGTTTLTDDGGYVFQTNQGTLQHDYIVVSGGGGAEENSGIEPAPAEVEDGFKSNDTTNDKYFATGTTGTTAGNMNDPDNNALADTQDSTGTWDVDIGWLLDALTFDDGRHQLLIGFDYNEPQNLTDETLDYWALISVLDSSGTLDPINYEIRDFTGLTYDAFTTDKEFNSKPGVDDFSTVNGISCVYKLAGAVVNVTSQPGGSCADPGVGYDELIEIKNTLATNLTEIITYLPELDDMLEYFMSIGYDTVSARVLLGCFDNNSQDNTIGQGYLDGDGATTNCGEGGFPDIFLMAGDVKETTTVPSPSPLMLISLGLILLSMVRSKRKAT